MLLSLKIGCTPAIVEYYNGYLSLGYSYVSGVMLGLVVLTVALPRASL